MDDRTCLWLGGRQALTESQCPGTGVEIFAGSGEWAICDEGQLVGEIVDPIDIDGNAIPPDEGVGVVRHDEFGRAEGIAQESADKKT